MVNVVGGEEKIPRAEEDRLVKTEEDKAGKTAGHRAWNEDGPGRNASARSQGHKQGNFAGHFEDKCREDKFKNKVGSALQKTRN